MSRSRKEDAKLGCDSSSELRRLGASGGSGVRASSAGEPCAWSSGSGSGSSLRAPSEARAACASWSVLGLTRSWPGVESGTQPLGGLGSEELYPNYQIYKAYKYKGDSTGRLDKLTV